jgi:hypothetical protein
MRSFRVQVDKAHHYQRGAAIGTLDSLFVRSRSPRNEEQETAMRTFCSSHLHYPRRTTDANPPVRANRDQRFL